jgi:hypothetical protein
MLFSKDYVGYLSRQVVRRLAEAKVIRTDKPALLAERINIGLIDELSLEDRINEEARAILESIQGDMLKAGASYPEMFKKIKLRLVQQYKAVL